jgi:predicted transcriptional regulator
MAMVPPGTQYLGYGNVRNRDRIDNIRRVLMILDDGFKYGKPTTITSILQRINMDWKYTKTLFGQMERANLIKIELTYPNSNYTKPLVEYRITAKGRRFREITDRMYEYIKRPEDKPLDW